MSTEADIRKKLRAIAKRKISLAEKLRWARVNGFSDGYNEGHCDHAKANLRAKIRGAGEVGK